MVPTLLRTKKNSPPRHGDSSDGGCKTMIVKVFKGEVNNRGNSIACEFCGDWYHTRCAGLKEASQRLLSNDFLIGLCPECLVVGGETKSKE
ncbi:hypothetical protein E2C01_083108 [Portunus trituberculatus]|uniref:PHD-type domain-containing protein n=1 Tax=Portunus trituberculatus TaxID=210409 RepID=A0A5B7IU15_PORTR|nr:hypothetical protein [Portunus trituberculatus]